MDKWTDAERANIQRRINEKHQEIKGEVIEKPNVWQTRTADGDKKMFMNDKKAEEMLRQGYFITKKLQKRDL